MGMDKSSNDMIAKKDIPAYQARKLVKDIQAVQQSDNPAELARLQVAAAKSSGWNAPYLHTTLMGKLAVFNHYLDAGASTDEDQSEKCPIDVALCVEYKDGIEALVKHPNGDTNYKWTIFQNCSPEIVLYFAAQMHKYHKNNTKKLVDLSYDVLLHSPEKARQLAQQNLLFIPPHNEWDSGKDYYRSSLPQSILTLYANNGANLPQELYERAKRCSLRSLTSASHLIESEKQSLLDLLQNNHRITFVANDNDDEALAWNSYAQLLVTMTKKDADSFSKALKELEENKVSLPDRAFTTAILNKLLSPSPRERCAFRWCLDHEADPSCTAPQAPKHELWTGSPSPYEHPLARIAQGYQPASADQLFTLFDQYIDPLTSDEWCVILSKIGNSDRKLEATRKLLEHYQEQILSDSNNADLVCDWAEAQPGVADSRAIIDIAWRYTSADRYKARKLQESLTTGFLQSIASAAQSRELAAVSHDKKLQ
jgi:hypothetical protein